MTIKPNNYYQIRQHKKSELLNKHIYLTVCKINDILGDLKKRHMI